MLVKSILLAVMLFVSAVFAADCGPPQCYSPCTNTRPIVDFVFMLDVSGSMKAPIDGVTNGLKDFVGNLTNKITPRFALVIFGKTGSGAAFLDLQFTSVSSDFIAKMKWWVQNINGGTEPGLETFLRVLNKANAGPLDLQFNTGLNTQKVFIMVTNEDSDPPSYDSANRFYNGLKYPTEDDNYCKEVMNNYCDHYSHGSYVTADTNQIPLDVWPAYQKEVNAVAAALIAAKASVYMFVAGSQSIKGVSTKAECEDSNQPSYVEWTCLTTYQYCNPDAQSQNATFGNFNPAATLTLMNNAGTQNSLQGQLINAGRTARCFDVRAASNPALVQNFFSEIVADVSACQTTCFNYTCTSPTTCATPVNMCGCDGVRDSGQSLDPAGVCCGAKDCNGYCNQYTYDACGICTKGGATSPYCKTDCNSTLYISAVPPLAYQVPDINVAGYLLMNPTVKNLYTNTYKNKAGVQKQFHDTGLFQGLSFCTLDLAAYNTKYSLSLDQAHAEDDWLISLLTASPKVAQCLPGSHRRFHPYPTDSCGQCITNSDAPPYCVKDCEGIWRTTLDSTKKFDNCGACVAQNANPDAAKDYCGVCNGGNATLNDCLQCGGTKAVDQCGQPVCRNQTCGMDCDGQSRPVSTMTLDECNNCVARSLNPPRDPKCVQDCAGTWFNNVTSTSSPHRFDECGNCILRNSSRPDSCKQDCKGIWAGHANYDQCGQCVTSPDPNCKLDCNGTYYLGSLAPSIVDSCGICNPRGAQNTLKDLCGVCKNQPGYNTDTDCTPDCKGIYSLTSSTGRAFEDACDDCWFANETAKNNYNMDSCGVCRANRSDPNWNHGSGISDSQGKDCACGQIPQNCSDGSNTCSDSCPVYCPDTTNILPDSCGFCPGAPMYNKTDNCGLCCDNTTANPCDIYMDSCGVCLGFDRDRQNPCNICDPTGKLCVQDCNEDWGGHAVMGCDGICGSNAVCAVCGDGVKQPGETCDLGSTGNVNNNKPGSGCTADCQVESGGNVGAAIGGAIGGIAAIAALALAAFFAVRYAKKAGLIGNANKQVDFGASNSNPLYKSETSVHQNPLYEN